jgi:hypothetical protein
MSDNVDVHDNPAQHRYEITVDGDLADFAVYYLEKGRIVFIHTEVAIAYEGQGPFFAAYIRGHPEYQDLTRDSLRHRVVLGEQDS